MNYIYKLMLASIMFACITNGLFAAGARVSVQGDDRYVAVKLLPTSGDPLLAIIPSGATVSLDAGVRGFVGLEWLDCENYYKIAFGARIEGIEGWRDWNIMNGGMVNIGASGLLAAFGTLQGNLVKKGYCPCKFVSQ